MYSLMIMLSIIFRNTKKLNNQDDASLDFKLGIANQPWMLDRTKNIFKKIIMD